MRGGCDEGFCFLYWKLSYRRKFYRTLWMMLVFAVVGGIFWAVDPESHTIRFGVIMLAVTCIGLVQALYNYRRWQTEAAEPPTPP